VKAAINKGTQMRQIFRYCAGSLVWLAIGAHAPATVAQQESPPAPGAPRQLNLPRPVERTLKNGLRVVVIEDHDTPLVSAKVLIKNGGEVDPPQLSGLAQLTATLLTKGTKTRTATETAQAIEPLGGELTTDAGWDSSQATVTVISSKLAPAAEVLADVVCNPRFKEEELERLRQQVIDSLNVGLSQPGQLANLVAARVVFGESAYGHALAGTPQSVARIKREDVARLHASYYRPNNAVLVFSGDVKAEAAFLLAKRLFGSWPKAALPELAKETPPTTDAKARVVVIDMPNAGQSAVMLARSGVKRTDPDYYHGLVANSLFGGGYSSRLNQEVRIKRGLSYGAGSALSARRATGPFFVSTQTKNESAAEVAALMLAELERLGAAPLPEAELQPRRANLTGQYGRALETTEGLAAQTASLALYGVSFTEINNYLKNVQAVTEADVRRFATERLKATGANLIIVGDASKFLAELLRRFPQTEVIEKDQLDLEGVSLRKSRPESKQR
jgi:zinc protease